MEKHAHTPHARNRRAAAPQDLMTQSGLMFTPSWPRRSATSCFFSAPASLP